MLKFADKWEHSQVCLGYAKREQFGRSQNGKVNNRGTFKPRENYKSLNERRLKDGKVNSRGFLNPWETRSPSTNHVWKTGNWIPRDFQVPGHVAVPRLSDAILLILSVSTDLKVRGYSPSASRLSDAFSPQLISHRSLLYTPLHRGRGEQGL